MKNNKININDYKLNYPNSVKSYKEIYDLKIPFRAISISDSGQVNYFMFTIQPVLILTHAIKLTYTMDCQKKK